MPDFLLQQNASYLLTENAEPLLLESSLPVQLNNYEHAATVGDGMSITEKIK